MRTRRLISIAAPLALVGLASVALVPSLLAQPEPAFPGNTPIEITVLFPAGSSADVSARLLADGMSKRLGVNVIVVDRPGAGGALGYKFVAGQKPDGHSLVWNSNSISTTYYSGTLPFTFREFEPVARVLAESPVVAVPGNSPWKTLGDLMAAAKAKPKAITVANSGTGSHTHISSVALFNLAGAEVVDVPFGAAMPRQASSETSKPCSCAVGTSGNAGSRTEVSDASSRSCPDRTDPASAAGSCTAASTCPPSSAGTSCAAPNGTSTTSAFADLNSATDEMCVWLPFPELATVIAFGFALAAAMRSERLLYCELPGTATTGDSASTRATGSNSR